MTTIEDAIGLAIVAHRRQTDKAGLPYILHPLRVMSQFVSPFDDDARIVAVLHDIVEDTYVTIQDLSEFGYSLPVILAVDALTRMRNEAYPEYIERVSRNPLAVRVKLADLRDNLDPKRVSTQMLNPRTVAKYQEAREFLARVLVATSSPIPPRHAKPPAEHDHPPA